MPFVQTEQLSLYYEVQGTGPRLLVLLGSGSDLRHQPNIFHTLLPSSFEVLAFDQRGQGRSDAPDQPYTMADYADDANALLDMLGWDRCHVLGISFGGMVAQEFALRYPERVEKLVLGCSSSGGQGGASYPIHELEALPLAQRVEGMMPLFDVRHSATWKALEGAEYKRGQRRLEKMLHRLAEATEDPALATGRKHQLTARMGHDTYERLPQLQAHTLICGGAFDGVAPPANQLALYRQLPNAHLVFFDGGHLFTIDDPQSMLRIADFLLGEEDQRQVALERGYTHYLFDDLGTADEAFSKAIEGTQAPGFAHLYRAEIPRLQGVLDGSLERLHVLAEAYPETALGQLAKSLFHNLQDEDELATTHMTQALALVGDDDPLTEALLLQYKGDAFYEQDEEAEAIEWYTRSIKRNPLDPVSYMNRGQAHLELKQYTQAIANCDESLRLFPLHTEARHARSEAFEGLGRISEALDDLNVSLEVQPNNEEIRLKRAQLYLLLEKKEEAMRDFDQAIAKNPESADAYFARAEYLFSQGEWEKAIEDYNQVLSRDMERWQAYFKRGCAYHQRGNQGDLDYAISDYSNVTYRENSATDAWNNRGLAYQQKGLLDAATNDFTEVLYRNDKDEFAYANRGNIYLMRNLFPEALTDYDKAIELAPEDPDLYFNRANAREETGDLRGALADLERFLSLGGKDKHEEDDTKGRMERLKATLESAS